MSTAAGGMAGRDAPDFAAPTRAAASDVEDRAEPQGLPGVGASVAPTIGAVSLTGSEGLGYASMSQAFAPFIGQTADPLTLQTLARTMADEARSRGYLFATASVPDQAMVMGVVRVQLDLGRIDEVRVLGSTNRRLLSLLKALQGKTPRTADLERRLLLAGDLPGIVVLGSRFEMEHGLGVFEVRVAARKAQAVLTADTYGPKAYGPVRARISADIHDLGFDGSRLNLQATRALDGDELTYAAVRYSAVVADGAGVIGVAASIGSTYPGLGLSYRLGGESVYGSIFGSWNLMRSRKASVWLNADLTYLGIDQDVGATTFRRDRTVTVSASLSGNRVVAKGRLSGEVGMTRGVAPSSRLGTDGLGSVRPEADSEFTKTTAWVSYVLPLSKRSQMRVMAMGQMASRPLPNAWEMGIGGPSYGRAFDFSERFGDQGVAASVEVSHDLKMAKAAVDNLQVYGFADAGKVTERGVQRLGQGELVSAGAGLRVQKGRLDLALEAALPLNTERYYSGDRSPRINAQARWRF